MFVGRARDFGGNISGPFERFPGRFITGFEESGLFRADQARRGFEQRACLALIGRDQPLREQRADQVAGFEDQLELKRAAVAAAFENTPVRFCLVSFTSDWLFPTPESRAVVHALNAVAANVSFVEIESDKGHDAFLLDEPEFRDVLSGFLNGCAEHKGLNGT